MSFTDVSRGSPSSRLKKKQTINSCITLTRKQKFMNTMSQFSRTDNLLFKDRSFSCTLDLIDLVKQIQCEH